MLFSEIQGQEAIKKKLVRTVLDQRVSHAQLFFGPEGNEKLALAIAYAQFINCQNRYIPTGDDLSKADSCGVCPSCIKYQKLIHPDLHFIYPVATTKKISKKPKSIYFIEEWREFLISNNYNVELFDWYEHIGIENKQGIINAEDCNDIIQTLSYKSYESEYKVMILWMVEKLFHAAAPKILKILEEPPEKTLFILIATDPEQIISTIKSRTLMIKIPKSTVIHKKDEPEDESDFQTFRQWMQNCYGRKYADLVAFSAEIARTGRERQKNFLTYALKTIRSCCEVNAGNASLVIAGENEREFIRKISAFINFSNIEEFSRIFNEAISHIERNASAQILFLDLSLQSVKLFHNQHKK